MELSKTIDSLNAQMKQHQEVVQATPPPPKEPVKERKPVKIKVLAGNGNIASAKNLAKRLDKMGYPVKSIEKPRVPITR